MRFYEILQEAAPSSPEFRNWFGQSRIVDSNGEPMRLYHGTTENFEIFRPGDGRNGTVLGSEVMYFTADPAHAGGFGLESFAQAREAGRGYRRQFLPGANVVPVYLKIVSPLHYSADMPLGDKLVELAKAKGHDGIIFSTGRDDVNRYREVVAFHPNQIKSAFEHV